MTAFLCESSAARAKKAARTWVKSSFVAAVIVATSAQIKCARARRAPRTQTLAARARSKLRGNADCGARAQAEQPGSAKPFQPIPQCGPRPFPWPALRLAGAGVKAERERTSLRTWVSRLLIRATIMSCPWCGGDHESVANEAVREAVRVASGRLGNVVGVAGFEPATPSSRTRCSTRLSHTPTFFGRRSYSFAATGLQAP